MRLPEAHLRAALLATALLAGPAVAAEAPEPPALSASAVMQAASAVIRLPGVFMDRKTRKKAR